MGYPFCQFGSAVLVLNPPSSRFTPAYFHAPHYQGSVRSWDLLGSVQHCSATTRTLLCYQHCHTSPMDKTCTPSTYIAHIYSTYITNTILFDIRTNGAVICRREDFNLSLNFPYFLKLMSSLLQSFIPDKSPQQSHPIIPFALCHGRIPHIRNSTKTLLQLKLFPILTSLMSSSALVSTRFSDTSTLVGLCNSWTRKLSSELRCLLDCLEPMALPL